jgi:hypothetical protein
MLNGSVTCVYLLGLHHRAREAVEDKAASALRALDGILDDANDNLIGHEFARLHGLLGLEAHLGAVTHGLTQDIARGQVAQAVLVLDERRLRALTTSRRAYEPTVSMLIFYCDRSHLFGGDHIASTTKNAPM